MNVVQALETFHARFFYNDKKSEYVKSVKRKFSDSKISEEIMNDLISGYQEKSKIIILASRINDLLFDNLSGIFVDYWPRENNFTQRIVDSRNYYTHYDPSKEEKALKGEELKSAIGVLSCLLDYHVCKILGIDISEQTRRTLTRIGGL